MKYRNNWTPKQNAEHRDICKDVEVELIAGFVGIGFAIFILITKFI